MKFENPFSSSGRESRKSTFIPLEEMPDSGPTPEEAMLIQESSGDEDEEIPEDSQYEDEEAGVPPSEQTHYDRLIALANDESNLVLQDTGISGEIEKVMDLKGLRPSHRDRRDEALNYSYRPTHGFRGKEHPDKHQKGAEKTQ